MSTTAPSPVRRRTRVGRAAGGAEADPAAGAGERGPAPGGGVSVAGEPAGKRLYPLVTELAAYEDPCGGDVPGAQARSPALLPVAGAPRHRRRVVEAYRANALFDAHRDDPEFGLPAPRRRGPRRRAGDGGPHRVADLRRQRLVERVRQTPARQGERPGPPVHDDLGAAASSPPTGPNELWLTDITEHSTAEGKLYLCAIKDVCSNRIVGYSIDSRMKSRLAVSALEQRRRPTRRRRRLRASTATADRNSDARKFRACPDPPPHGRIDGTESAPPATTPPWRASSPAAEERPQPPLLDHPRAAADRDRDLDRTDLPPPPPTGPPRPFDAHRVRNHHPCPRPAAGRPGSVSAQPAQGCAASSCSSSSSLPAHEVGRKALSWARINPAGSRHRHEISEAEVYAMIDSSATSAPRWTAASRRALLVSTKDCGCSSGMNPRNRPSILRPHRVWLVRVSEDRVAR